MAATTGERALAIRSAALDLFVQRGYEATTMADIGAAVGIRGPSLYKHVASKQELLAGIIDETMRELLAANAAALAGATDPTERLRRAVDAHVRYHARHRREAFIGTRELRSLVEPHRSAALAQRAEYAGRFVDLIAEGVGAGAFHTHSPTLAAYAILDLGMGVAVWFRENGQFSENEVAWHHTEIALRIVGAKTAPGQ
ncbi:transcriptional regulator, TetR family [Pseudonocardia thermophila]|uniref:Transcriptional regulator, TetR family n=1 Tax=Pseudonocardia thermophila TaxID=1848 RepID=A0A1M6Q8G7_PSETH|nr:TetR/AcrR family transcriptional regulator [Pseudonocardia thermophila]SHK16448.1 transcriptional regulator, TetR family [Pseudonocardia thermophila]